jgi:hypothetical protein
MARLNKIKMFYATSRIIFHLTLTLKFKKWQKPPIAPLLILRKISVNGQVYKRVACAIIPMNLMIMSIATLKNPAIVKRFKRLHQFHTNIGSPKMDQTMCLQNQPNFAQFVLLDITLKNKT